MRYFKDNENDVYYAVKTDKCTETTSWHLLDNAITISVNSGYVFNGGKYSLIKTQFQETTKEEFAEKLNETIKAIKEKTGLL